MNSLAATLSMFTLAIAAGLGLSSTAQAQNTSAALPSVDARGTYPCPQSKILDGESLRLQNDVLWCENDLRRLQGQDRLSMVPSVGLKSVANLQECNDLSKELTATNNRLTKRLTTCRKNIQSFNPNQKPQQNAEAMRANASQPAQPAHAPKADPNTSASEVSQ